MKLLWTEHSKIKMRQYGLSKQKLLGILARSERKEKGIVLGTIAVMKTNLPSHKASARQGKVFLKWKYKKAPGEVWIMYKNTKDFRKIISAWRYPGISKPGEAIPIPEDIRQELLEMKD